jgi:hypothetical protein
MDELSSSERLGVAVMRERNRRLRHAGQDFR